jgi:hypothetical protein
LATVRAAKPYTRPGILHLLDKRAAHGKFLAKERRDLAAIAGGAPTLLQQKLIERAARVALRVHLMDMRSLTDPEWAERNERHYLAWSITMPAWSSCWSCTSLATRGADGVA